MLPKVTSVGEPSTERCGSFWGSADRYHWRSGGWSVTDGRASAETDGRPMIWAVTESRADRTAPDERPAELAKAA